MEIMCVIEVVAQLGTYRHSPDEVRGDFLTADLSLPGKVQHQRCICKQGNGSYVYDTLKSYVFPFTHLSVS